MKGIARIGVAMLAVVMLSGLASATMVTFNVDLSHQQTLGNFDPLLDGVGIRGDMNGWAGADGLVDVEEDLTYTTTLDLADGPYNYKFVIWIGNDPENLIWEGTIGDRNVEVAGVPLDLPLVWFDDNEPGGASYDVTFNVDLSNWEALGNFDPLLDGVGIRGDMNGWSGADQLIDPEEDMIYSTTLSIEVGTTNYKFVVWPDMDSDNVEWEDNVNNRSVEVIDGPVDVPVVWFDNNSPVVINYEVVFRINMDVQQGLGVFNPAADGIIVRGGRPELGNWDGFTQLTRLGQSDLWSAEIQFDDLEPGTQVDYKFLIDYDNDQMDPVEWETVGGPFDNRSFTPDGTEPDEDDDTYLEMSFDPAWFSLEEPAAIASMFVGPYQTVIGPDGGPIGFEVMLHNNLGGAFNAHLWVSAMLPNGNTINLAPTPVTVQPGVTIFMDGVSVNVPPTAPAGNYFVSVNAGNYPTFVGASDSFILTKQGVAAGSSVWSVDGLSDQIAADEEIVEISAQPMEFALNAAYPNPFNPTTTVSVNLPESAELTVSVFNIQGRLVTTLAQGNFNAGQHTLTFDAANLASGIYFIHAEVPGQLNAMQKVTLMK
jgi:Secretion system C-terminal sorting domain/Starch binding domain